MSRVERWERRTEIPMALLALAFLVAYAWPILDPRLDLDWRQFLTIVSWTVWIAFALDFAARLHLADDRVDYAVRHWYDVALVALPMLRPLRLLRLAASLRVLDRTAANTFAGRALVYVCGAAVATVGLGALSVLNAERDAAGATIVGFGDAVWWACSTVTTVGYGDVYPVTTEGRCVAVVVMVVGIGLVGTVVAAVGSAMMSRATAGR